VHRSHGTPYNKRLSRRIPHSLIGPILEEIYEHSLGFQTFSISHVRREANMSAHCCAKYACIQDENRSWDVEPPDFLEHSLFRPKQ
jgi:hypothetical protein